MAMVAGTVSIADSGVATASGMAASLYTALSAIVPPTIDQDNPATPDVLKKRGYAVLANALASAIVTYLQSNCVARVTTSNSGLQRMPAVTTENEPCKAPSGNVDLAIF